MVRPCHELFMTFGTEYLEHRDLEDQAMTQTPCFVTGRPTFNEQYILWFKMPRTTTNPRLPFERGLWSLANRSNVWVDHIVSCSRTDEREVRASSHHRGAQLCW